VRDRFFPLIGSAALDDEDAAVVADGPLELVELPFRIFDMISFNRSSSLRRFCEEEPDNLIVLAASAPADVPLPAVTVWTIIMALPFGSSAGEYLMFPTFAQAASNR
jgi:hypothetical protein